MDHRLFESMYQLHRLFSVTGMNGRLCSANLNSGKEMFVARFTALLQHLPRRIEEIMKILMQYIKCTSHDLIQTNVIARARLFGGVSRGGGNIYIQIYNYTTSQQP
jgi:hypothetical protein